MADKCHDITDKHINLFYRLNSSCLSDESVQQVLNALHKQKNVGGLQIAMKSISADTALILTDFLQTKAKWEEIRYLKNIFLHLHKFHSAKTQTPCF